jgi:phosphoribosylglycinamide formyltransferase 1
MLAIGVLGSTRGSNLIPLQERLKQAQTAAEIRFLISNQPQAGILDRAIELEIPHSCIPSKGQSRADFEGKVTQAFQEYQVKYILLMGFMRIVSADFITHWKGNILNVHPSLLPNYAGLMDMDIHRAVIADACAQSGCTVHYVSDVVDEGPILVQKSCAVLADDSAERLKKRVQELEVQALFEAIQFLCQGDSHV